MTAQSPQPRTRPVRRVRKAVAMAAMVVVALCGVFYLLLRSSAPPSAGRPSSQPNPYGRSATAVLPQLPEPAASSVARRPPQAGETELCGVGVLSFSGVLDFVFDRSAQVRTVRGLLVTLAANPDPRAQATGLYLQAHEANWDRDRRQQFEDMRACEGVPDVPQAVVPPACRQAREREHAHWQTSMSQSLAASMQLAQLAQRSGDPQVLAIAFGNCQSLGDAAAMSACQQGLLERWAAVEPDNAAPWLNLLSQARAAKSHSAAANALYHLSLAKYERGYMGVMVPWIVRNVPAAQRNGDDQRLLELAAGTLYAVGLPSYGGLGQACGQAQLQDANVRQWCHSAVDVLANQPDNLISLSLSHRLGQGLGWPPERLARIEVELQALRYATTQLAAEGPLDAPACAAQDRLQRYLRALGEFGEVGGLRRVMAASGKSMEQLAQEYQRSDLAKPYAALQARKASGAASSNPPP